MLRVNSSDVLVVPPFECAWIEKALLKDSAGCITFEAQGDNDATLILKSKPGSKRWQHMELGAGGGGKGSLAVDHNYTVIFGSHQNTCLKIEKNSQECFRVHLPSSVSGSSFVSCWVNYDKGSFRLGTGHPGSAPCHAWSDPHPIQGIRHVGLGTWDKHVCFRNIRTHAPLAQGVGKSLSSVEAGKAEEHSNVPRLATICEKAVVDGVTPSTVCAALCLVDLLSPVLDGAAPALVSHLARCLVDTLAVDTAGFQSLPAGLIAEMLGNPCLACREKVVFDAVERWAYASPSNPCWGELARSLADVEGLLLLIRFPLMSHSELQELRERELAQRSPLLGELLSEASDARMHSSQEMQAERGLAVEGKRNVKALEAPAPRTPTPGTPERFRRQHAPASKHLMFVSHGDSNGLSHWLGTNYGRGGGWVNPVLAGMMQVQASSPSCKHTDPKALVGGNFLRLNMAGPGRSGTWWQIDLGPHHRLICNYYTLRHDASYDFPRDWSLQASTDGNGWVDLRRHHRDVAISMPGQGASFPVSGHAASMPYRLFRILLTGPTAGVSSHRHSLHLSLFELYGHFFHIR